MSKVIVFPENERMLPGDMIQVVLGVDGPAKTIVELPREALDAIKRIAGADYINHLKMLYFNPTPDAHQSLYSERTTSNRSLSCM